MSRSFSQQTFQPWIQCRGPGIVDVGSLSHCRGFYWDTEVERSVINVTSNTCALTTTRTYCVSFMAAGSQFWKFVFIVVICHLVTDAALTECDIASSDCSRNPDSVIQQLVLYLWTCGCTFSDMNQNQKKKNLTIPKGKFLCYNCSRK